MTPTHLVNMFLGRAFLMVVGVGIRIIEPPHVGITEKNLKHTRIAFTQHQHLLTCAETEQLLRARRTQPQAHTPGVRVVN